LSQRHLQAVTMMTLYGTGMRRTALFGVSLSGFSNSASFLADSIVAAIKIANFLSSIIGNSAFGIMRQRMEKELYLGH
jgi:hypothetical protein